MNSQTIPTKSNAKPEPVMTQSIEANAQLGLAIDALEAVRELCCEAANGQSQFASMNHVNPDHFASLLGLIVNEMRSAYDDASVGVETR